MNFYSSIALAVFISQASAEDPIAKYYPVTDVRDHANIDLDQAALMKALEPETVAAFALAKTIYEKGGYSKSRATVTLTQPLDQDGLTKDTILSGKTNDGNVFIGTVADNYDEGDTEIKIKYAPGQCYVGGLEFKDVNGCLISLGTAETLSDGLKEYEYTYNVGKDNTNERTLQGFSTAAPEKMAGERNADFYKNYYGSLDFADQWIQAAFASGKTNFENGNADFGLYTTIGRHECVKKSTSYVSTLMYAMHEFERSIPVCRASEANPYDNTDAVHAWDEGVAFYSGSLEGQDGLGSGKLSHALSEKRCQDFLTCGPDGGEATGLSQVSYKLLKLFNAGRDALGEGRCDDADTAIKGILKQVYIPLIQGTLRYAAKIELGFSDEKGQAEGAVFASGVLPRIHAANEGSAKIIYDEMKVIAPRAAGEYETDFAAVKAAFEKTYGKLGIDCKSIGGFIDKVTLELYTIAEHGIDSAPCDDVCFDKVDNVFSFGADGDTQSCYGLSTYTQASRDAVCGLSAAPACPGTCNGRCQCTDKPSAKYTNKKNGKLLSCNSLLKKTFNKIKNTCKPGKSDAKEICPMSCKGFCGFKGAN